MLQITACYIQKIIDKILLGYAVPAMVLETHLPGEGATEPEENKNGSNLKILRCFNHNEKGRGLSSVRYEYGTFSILSTSHSCVALKEMGHKPADRHNLTDNILTIIKRTAPLVFDTDVQIRGK